MDNQKRLIDLETKILHQDKIIEDLSDVIYKQQQQLDLLEKKIKNILNRIESGFNSESKIGPANDKPPHY